MSYVILYRSLKTGRVHAVVTDKAYGLLEFDTITEAMDHITSFNFPNDTPAQIVETDEL